MQTRAAKRQKHKIYKIVQTTIKTVSMKKDYRIIISGGGTGGHIFPALSIADAIKAKHPEAKILFVGANNRMEMQRVPDAGYEIMGLPIAGFDRKNLFKNFKVLWLIFKSQRMARRIIKEFAPQAAVGVGGYASGPTLKMAAKMNIPTLIQEQNSYAGVTNKILSKRAKMICVAYDGMERFFPHEKIKITGNPVRKNLLDMRANRKEAMKALKLESSHATSDTENRPSDAANNLMMLYLPDFTSRRKSSRFSFPPFPRTSLAWSAFTTSVGS